MHESTKKANINVFISNIFSFQSPEIVETFGSQQVITKKKTKSFAGVGCSNHLEELVTVYGLGFL